MNKNYQRLFHFEGIDFLMSDIWMSFYKLLGGMITAINDDCYMWLPKVVLDSQLDEGVTFFADNKQFEAYYSAHAAFLDSLEKTFVSEISNRNRLSKHNVVSFLELCRKSLSFFYKTDFLYTDKAYQHFGSNSVIKENLMKNYKLKQRSRVVIFNNVWFGKSSYLAQLLSILSTQFDVPVMDLKQYGINDIYALFDGKKLSSTIVQNRREARIMVGENKELRVYVGSQVKKDIFKLLEGAGELRFTMAVLRGISASSGKVTGKVKVIVSNPLTFDSLSDEMDKMNKGDILVAETTSPEFMPACAKACAIITNQGGLLSHAAVISRELGIPCIVGLKIATKVFKDGDLIEVDANKGIVKKVQK